MRHNVVIYRPSLVTPVRMGVQLLAVLDTDQARFAMRKPITAPITQVTLSLGVDYFPQLTLPGGIDVNMGVVLQHTDADNEVRLRCYIPGELEWSVTLVPADQVVFEATNSP